MKILKKIKNMIRGIHYFSTKLKTKIDVIPRSCFKQCSKLFKGLECAVLSMVLCTIKHPWSLSKRVGHIPDFGFPSVSMLPWLCRKWHKAIFTLNFTCSCTHGKIHWATDLLRLECGCSAGTVDFFTKNHLYSALLTNSATQAKLIEMFLAETNRKSQIARCMIS